MDALGIAQATRVEPPEPARDVGGRQQALTGNLHCAAQVNSSPFEEGWMMKVKLSDPSELEDLMDSATYEKTCEDH